MKILSKLKKSLEIILISIGIMMILSKISGIVPCILLSGSMEPELKTGSLVLINTNERNPDIGDIITYRMGTQKVTHRVTGTSDGKYLTKGDANQYMDANPVASSQIVGKVFYKIPFLGYIIAKIQSKTGIILLMAFLIISFISDLLSEVLSQIKFSIPEKSRKERAWKPHRK